MFKVQVNRLVLFYCFKPQNGQNTEGVLDCINLVFTLIFIYALNEFYELNQFKRSNSLNLYNPFYA